MNIKIYYVPSQGESTFFTLKIYILHQHQNGYNKYCVQLVFGKKKKGKKKSFNPPQIHLFPLAF